MLINYVNLNRARICIFIIEDTVHNELHDISQQTY